jgi:hypothetical protein
MCCCRCQHHIQYMARCMCCCCTSDSLCDIAVLDILRYLLRVLMVDQRNRDACLCLRYVVRICTHAEATSMRIPPFANTTDMP